MLFALTSFGAFSLLGGILGAGAVFYDYYQYIDIPLYNDFTMDEIAVMPFSNCEALGFVNTDLTYGGSRTVLQIKCTKPGAYSECSFGTSEMKNKNPESNTMDDTLIAMNYAANNTVNGKDIFGNSGVTMEDCDGFCVWVGQDSGPYTGKLKLSLYQVPAKGPWYRMSDDGSSDMEDYEQGAVFECNGVSPDENGYFFFDFKSNFNQISWWTTDDEGNNQYDNGITPIPQSKIPKISGIYFTVFNATSNCTYEIGDMKVFKDTRLHTDELDEYLCIYDALDTEAYTEESFEECTEVYVRAYDMFTNYEEYTQRQINEMALELKRAINSLKPMYHSRSKTVSVKGFDVWDEDDFDEITSGEICLDTPAVETDVVPYGADQSVLILGNATDGPPAYGWSLFTSSVLVDDDQIAAVKNPFELEEGSEPLSESSGLRFWIKWGDEFGDPVVPANIRIGVGSSADGISFETADGIVAVPEKEGYVGFPWSSFECIEDDCDIYDYIDSLDYFSLYLEGMTGIFYISDLQAFDWAIASADFDRLQTNINNAYNYLNSLNRNDYNKRSWERVLLAIEAAEELIGQYGITEEDEIEAGDAIQRAVSGLTLIKDEADMATQNKLEALVKSAKTYWRGNVTPSSYRALQTAVTNGEALVEKGPKQEEAETAIAELTTAISQLVPITEGGRVTTIFSFESYTNRDLNRATGDRTPGVDYKLDKTFAKLPAGYSQALKMTAQKNLSSENTDEHGMMQFKAMYREGDVGSVKPIKMDKGQNTLIGDLTGTDGLCFWVGVNDVNLVQRCTMRVAVSNCQVSPLFENAAIGIPIPATGSGWIYLPWEYFEYYDPWTNGQPTDLSKIYFYIFRFDGSIKEGLEVYITGIYAYKNTTAGTWNEPVIGNITDGQEIDISETPEGFTPDWTEGAAELNGEYFIYGNAISANGDYELVVTNGNKSKKVNFSITGGHGAEYTVPVVTGVEEGGEYEEEVTVGWDTGTATLNGEPFEAGKITEAGSYVLVVTNGDKNVTVRFTVKEKETPPPPPAAVKGDFDGDGAITVADALAALRIGAKLVEETPESIAIGDVDNDGHVTVADALAILRVAAKLVDHL